MMREIRTSDQPCGLKVKLGNLKTGTLKCVLKIDIHCTQIQSVESVRVNGARAFLNS